MSEQEYTLDVILGLDDRSMERLVAVVAKSRSVREMPAAVGEKLSPGYWAAVAARVGQKVHEVLDLPVSEVLAGAWRGYTPFLKYLDRDRYPPEDEIPVPLATHTVESKHAPYVELRVNDRPAGRVDFEVVVTITLEGAVLFIRDGRFRELRVASGKVEGTLSCEGQEVLRREAAKDLPGVISFGEGIPIAPPGTQPVPTA